MKDYPSIPSAIGQQFREIPRAQIFDKLDGSSMRAEWNRKQGWYKHGKRSGLTDDSNPHLVAVPAVFMAAMSETLAKIAVDSRWDAVVVFYEFWGCKSIAGLHFSGDPKFVTLFDAAPYKSPRSFANSSRAKCRPPSTLARSTGLEATSTSYAKA